MIGKGEKAPSFSLTDKDGIELSLDDIKSKFTVVYFYPKDSTPGCTLEANEFNANLDRFKKVGASVIGISGGNDKSKGKFCSTYKLTFPLLSDEDFSVAKAYSSYGKKRFMGREYMGILRKTFILDKNKKVVRVFDEVSPQGHAEEVLEAIRSVNVK